MEIAESLLKVKEVATRLNVAPSTIYTWAHKGILPAIKLGRALRFRAVAVDKLVNQGEQVIKVA